MTATLADLDWPRRTDRLLIRPARANDAAAVFAYRSRADVAMWMTSRADDPATHAATFADNLDGTLLVEYEGSVVGDVMLDLQDAWAQKEVAEQAHGTQAELGWCFHPDVHGRGLATEAVRELLAIAFDGIGLRRVEAACFADNAASRRVMEKIGLRQESYHVAESLHRTLGWVDGMQFALLADEWRASN